jgi:luciferase family oxidoreductase group 1
MSPTFPSVPDRSRIPLSILDLALVPSGQTSAQALADTAILAERADELGYLRFWVAEHHNMDTVASTTPSVLLAHLGARTRRIKLGSGGVMLPNHAPLAIAEQFALLEALYPGRVDLGIGRAPGTDQATAAVLRRGSREVEEDFPRNLLDVMGLLGDIRTESGLWDRFRATPVADSHPSVFLLGSSGFSPQLAGLLGIPFVFANHFDMGGTEHAVSIYRDNFQPSPVLDEPYTMVSATVIAAPDEQEAEWLSGPQRLRKFGMRTGHLLPLYPPEEAAAHPQFSVARQMPSNSIIGTPEQVVEGLEHLAKVTGAAELILSCATHALEHRIRTIELTAAAWQLSAPVS